MNWKSEYPYTPVKRVRHFGSDAEKSFEASDCMPPSIADKMVKMEDVYFAIEDAKQTIFDSLTRGHRLLARKAEYKDVQAVFDKVADILYNSSTPVKSK